MSTTGTSRVKGYDTIRFILPQQIPTGKKISYGRFVCEERPQKEEVQRTRLTVGGDRLEYDGDTATEVASMDTIKIFLNSVISTTNARFAAADIGNFYTNSRLPEPEYMKVNISDIPDEIIKEYDAMKYVDKNGSVYIQIAGALYGLKQSGKIANDDLIKFLQPHGYYSSKRTPGLWYHETKPISFTLVVDDLGVKYINKDDINHLFETLKKNTLLKSTGTVPSTWESI